MPQVKYKIVFFLISTLFILNSCKTSFNKIGDKNANYIPYYLTVYEADSLYNAGNYKATYYLLDSLFKKYEPIELVFTDEYSKYVECKSKIVGFKNTNKDIKKLTKIYGKNYLMKEEIDSVFLEIIKTNKISDNRLKKWRSSYLKKINYAVKDNLLKVYEYDQKYRNTNDDEYRKNFANQSYLDSLNRNKLNYVFENYGFPNEQLVGNYTIEKPLSPATLSVIIKHITIADYEKYYKNKLLEFIKKGTCHPMFYAMIDDRVRVAKGEKCMYGFYCETKDFLSEINKNRKQLGLKKLKPQICLLE